jgi:hypothetical protein
MMTGVTYVFYNVVALHQGWVTSPVRFHSANNDLLTPVLAILYRKDLICQNRVLV